jgi:hypothetical protein
VLESSGAREWLRSRLTVARKIYHINQHKPGKSRYPQIWMVTGIQMFSEAHIKNGWKESPEVVLQPMISNNLGGTLEYFHKGERVWAAQFMRLKVKFYYKESEEHPAPASHIELDEWHNFGPQGMRDTPGHIGKEFAETTGLHHARMDEKEEVGDQDIGAMEKDDWTLFAKYLEFENRVAATPVSRSTGPPGHDPIGAPEPLKDPIQASRTPCNGSGGVLGAKSALDPGATTKTDDATTSHRVTWKPAPDFAKRPVMKSPYIMSLPSRAQCARVPKRGSCDLRFDEVHFKGGEPDTDVTLRIEWSEPSLKVICCGDLEGGEPDAEHLYLVIGIFSGVGNRPKERVVLIKNRAHLFWTLRWNYMLLRGLRFLFSLKDVKRFRLYEVSKGDRSLGA